MSKLSKTLFLVSSCLVALIGKSAFAYNGIGFSGAMCDSEGKKNTTPPTINRSVAGASPFTGDGKLACPISYPPNTAQQFYYDSIQFEVVDQTTTASIACIPFSYLALSGVQTYGVTKVSCNVWGGCGTDIAPAAYGPTALFWNNTESFLGHSAGGHNFVYDHMATAIFCTAPVGITAQNAPLSILSAYRFYLN